MKILLDLLDLLDDPHVTGESVVNRLKSWGIKHSSSKTIGTNGKTTDFVSVLIRPKRQDCRRNCSDPRHRRPSRRAWRSSGPYRLHV